MHTSPGPVSRRSPWLQPVPVDGEVVSLAELLSGGEPAGAARISLRTTAGRLRPWTQTWTRRATEWGAGPQGAWRAW